MGERESQRGRESKRESHREKEREGERERDRGREGERILIGNNVHDGAQTGGPGRVVKTLVVKSKDTSSKYLSLSLPLS